MNDQKERIKGRERGGGVVLRVKHKKTDGMVGC